MKKTWNEPKIQNLGVDQTQNGGVASEYDYFDLTDPLEPVGFHAS